MKLREVELYQVISKAFQQDRDVQLAKHEGYGIQVLVDGVPILDSEKYEGGLPWENFEGIVVLDRWTTEPAARKIREVVSSEE